MAGMINGWLNMTLSPLSNKFLYQENYTALLIN